MTIEYLPQKMNHFEHFQEQFQRGEQDLRICELISACAFPLQFSKPIVAENNPFVKT